jgi:hypothetical protein
MVVVIIIAMAAVIIGGHNFIQKRTKARNEAIVQNREASIRARLKVYGQA